MLITRDEACRWAARFRPRLADLWEGIRQFAFALDSASSDDLVVATASFMFAVGNFKRQSAIFLSSPDVLIDEDWEAGEEILLSGIGMLARDRIDSWVLLDRVPGIGVPTATAALAALWPSRHAIFDVLTVQAATALRGVTGCWDGPVPPEVATAESPPGFDRLKWLTWEMYDWYLDKCVLPTSELLDLTPQVIERALFEVIRWQLRKDRAGANESWEEYGHRLVRCLAIDCQ